ncbi:hypothetical protein [Hyalangium sp.]|uniref:hypothetical protein n=1 Tax=Hyalangium sp. TaxID=2028555 RepID=UPI002D510EE3|nr:hypothetical protein [Hyalangium sp.]HYI00231.1 hypothetical protein [Hyalangium sp.]
MHSAHSSESPRVPVARAPALEGDLEQVAGGQELIIIAILVYFTMTVMMKSMGSGAGLLGLVALVLGLCGVSRMAKGMGMSPTRKILLVLLMFVPLVSLIVLLILNSRASSVLRAAGYRAGFFGASK